MIDFTPNDTKMKMSVVHMSNTSSTRMSELPENFKKGKEKKRKARPRPRILNLRRNIKYNKEKLGLFNLRCNTKYNKIPAKP